MAEFKATAAQANAVSARGSAVLVSAGAGSGKTRVLTERLMGYLTDSENPVDLDRFLVITFTRAAAGELRSRITEELSAALAADPGNRRLRRQSALCRRAQIGTIHSFCASLLREYSHLLGLSPDFAILDEERAAAMQAAALEKVLDESYEKKEDYPGFLLLADTVGAGRDDRRLAELVLNLYEKMQCHARPEQWAAGQVRQLQKPASDAGQTPWGVEILQWASGQADYWSAEMERMLTLMRGEEKIFKAYAPSMSETADALRELSRCLALGWDRARACLPIPFTRLGGLRNSPDAELSETVKARRDACKKAMAALSDALYADSETLLREMAQTAPAMSALLDLTLRFDRQFAADKRRASVVDYADLEHMTARLLTKEDASPTELAELISQRYTEIMVDEYQDVSQVQDVIFRAVSREGSNLFLVGDVKQSIYRFRLADPTIFTEKYLRYADAEKAAPGEPRRILLQENFRSRPEVLDAANSVFLRCMSRQLGDLDYDENAMLRAGASYEDAGAVPQLLLLELPKAADDEETPEKAVLEAELAAGEIRRLVDSGATVTDRFGTRPISYGDIAILLRAVSSAGGVYRRVLAQHGIPVATGQGGGYFSSVEISTAMSMLAVLDNPHQDIPLIAVLRSPVFGFDADELSEIRAADRNGDFYTALLAAAESGGKAADFVQRLTGLRELAADLPVEELIWRLLGELDLLAMCSAMTDGEQRRANLMALAELSHRFESGGYRGLHRFVLWLRRMAERGQEPAVGGPGAEAVQILSVHKSKGLEFPVVFLCDTARRFNRQDSRDTVLVHPELGLGPKLTDLKKRVEYPTLARHAIRLRLEREMLSEEMRLLYVAMTRAKERLYMTAAMKNPEQTVEKLRRGLPLAPQTLASASSPAEWLISAALADGEEHLRLRLCTAEQAGGEQTAAELPAVEADEEAAKELERNLRFSYPWPEAEELPSKLTATELKGRAEPDEDAKSLLPRAHSEFRLPDFARKNRPLTGAQRGTATHLVLQYMDFAATGSRAEIEKEIERLRARRVLSDAEAEAVDAAAIERLFRSELGQRMLHAPEREREFKFSLLCDAGELLGRAAGEEILLQGVVDCCLLEEDGLVIIDYKTDSVRTEAEIAARSRWYEGQLQAYAAALSRIFARPVKECLLYFLVPGAAVAVPVKKM